VPGIADQFPDSLSASNPTVSPPVVPADVPVLQPMRENVLTLGGFQSKSRALFRPGLPTPLTKYGFREQFDKTRMLVYRATKLSSCFILR
jgi:hypothetical protein